MIGFSGAAEYQRVFSTRIRITLGSSSILVWSESVFVTGTLCPEPTSSPFHAERFGLCIFERDAAFVKMEAVETNEFR